MPAVYFRSARQRHPKNVAFLIFFNACKKTGRGKAGDTKELNEVTDRISRFYDKNPEIRITRLTLNRSAKN